MAQNKVERHSAVYLEEPRINTFAGDVSLLTTISLPLHTDWQEATEVDTDLKMVKEALENYTTLSKAALNNKKLYRQWGRKALSGSCGK
eukprot:4149301-Ditylum_brightwellii.AAC.1